VTTFRPPRRYAIWHDRAALHFLLDMDEERGMSRSSGVLWLPVGT
jgi:hypothetical protein